MFKELHLDNGISFRHADRLAKCPQGFGSKAAAAQAFERGKARIVPAVHQLAFHQVEQFSLAHDRESDVQSGEFDLLRTLRSLALLDHPVVERPMVLEFQRANRMGNTFHRIGERMREIVSRIDAPGRAGAVMGHMSDAIEHGIAQIDVRRGHVDFGAEHMCAVGEFPRPHPREIESRFSSMLRVR